MRFGSVTRIIKKHNSLKEQTLGKIAKPLVEAKKISAKFITSALKKDPAPEKTLFDFYNAKKDNDKYYSIYREYEWSFVLGNMYIEIDPNNDISIENDTYPYSKGIWNLLLLNIPILYTDNDLTAYKKIVEQTGLFDNPWPVGPGDKRTKKYQFLEKHRPIREMRRSRSFDEAGSSELVKNIGSRIQSIMSEGTSITLPGSINSLCSWSN